MELDSFLRFREKQVGTTLFLATNSRKLRKQHTSHEKLRTSKKSGGSYLLTLGID